ncbi:MAG TPA: hypothetical protein VHV10_13610, partial [Ktedonobacteraceae bacterium]|nr:hypothetical protein [Ktedonobacteraceae bacterium]
RSGAETPPDVPQEQAGEKDTVGGKPKKKIEPSGSVPPERSGAETPPDVRQQIVDILSDPLTRDRLKEILMRERSKEMEKLRNENEQLRAHAERLPGQIAQAIEERLTISHTEAILQIQARVGASGEAARVAEDVLAESYERVTNELPYIIQKLDDEQNR